MSSICLPATLVDLPMHGLKIWREKGKLAVHYNKLLFLLYSINILYFYCFQDLFHVLK